MSSLNSGCKIKRMLYINQQQYEEIEAAEMWRETGSIIYLTDKINEYQQKYFQHIQNVSRSYTLIALH
jgi:hypothetical protein